MGGLRWLKNSFHKLICYIGEFSVKHKRWLVLIVTAITEIILVLIYSKDITEFTTGKEWTKLLITMTFGAPIAFFIWLFRNHDKQRNLAQKDRDLDQQKIILEQKDQDLNNQRRELELKENNTSWENLVKYQDIISDKKASETKKASAIFGLGEFYNNIDFQFARQVHTLLRNYLKEFWEKENIRLMAQENSTPEIPEYIKAIHEIIRKQSTKKLNDKNFFHKENELNLNSFNLRYANFNKVNLHGSILKDVNLCDANLTSANISEAELSNTNLSNAHIYFANIKKTIMKDSSLIGADFTESDLSETLLWNIDLSDSIFKGSNFSSATLTAVKLNAAFLRSTNFKKAQMTNVDFINAKLEDIKFCDMKLVGVAFNKASLFDVKFNRTCFGGDNGFTMTVDGTDFTDADLQIANFIAADLRLAINLSKAKIGVVTYCLDETALTQFPEGFNLNQKGLTEVDVNNNPIKSEPDKEK